MQMPWPNEIYCPWCESLIELEKEDASKEKIQCPGCSRPMYISDYIQKYCTKCKERYKYSEENCLKCGNKLELYFLCPICKNDKGLIESNNKPCTNCAYVPAWNKQDLNTLNEVILTDIAIMDKRDRQMWGNSNFMINQTMNAGMSKTPIEILDKIWFKVLVPKDKRSRIKIEAYALAIGIVFLAMIVLIPLFGLKRGAGLTIIVAVFFYSLRNYFIKRSFLNIFNSHYNALLLENSKENSEKE